MQMKALIVWGGWDGHEPEQVAGILAGELRKEKVKVTVSNTLDTLADKKAMRGVDLVVPCWTAGELTGEPAAGLLEAVEKKGVGIAGVHGGMGDSFRNNPGYQFMVGGQFVAHPGGIIDYTVTITDPRHPVTRGLPSRFKYRSEQYYMHVDPGNKVLARTIVRHEGRRIDMPVVWTKPFGKGRVFYSALGHVAEEFATYPVALEIIRRGMLWAAKK